jgi:hypothetical protein
MEPTGVGNRDHASQRGYVQGLGQFVRRPSRSKKRPERNRPDQCDLRGESPRQEAPISSTDRKRS